MLLKNYKKNIYIIKGPTFLDILPQGNCHSGNEHFGRVGAGPPQLGSCMLHCVVVVVPVGDGVILNNVYYYIYYIIII